MPGRRDIWMHLSIDTCFTSDHISVAIEGALTVVTIVYCVAGIDYPINARIMSQEQHRQVPQLREEIHK